MNKISVIIPAFNAEKYIKETIESVLMQKVQWEVEIIGVNDGSTDRTSEIAESLGCIVVNQENKGLPAARNAGLRRATGNYIYYIDSDDILVDNAFERFIHEIEDDHEIQAIFAKASDFVSPELNEEEKNAKLPRREPYYGMMNGCSLIKSEVFEQVGQFDENQKYGDATAWYIKMVDKGIRYKKIDFISLKRRIHTNNMGMNQEEERKGHLDLLRKRMQGKL